MRIKRSSDAEDTRTLLLSSMPWLQSYGTMFVNSLLRADVCTPQDLLDLEPAAFRKLPRVGIVQIAQLRTAHELLGKTWSATPGLAGQRQESGVPKHPRGTLTERLYSFLVMAGAARPHYMKFLECTDVLSLRELLVASPAHFASTPNVGPQKAAVLGSLQRTLASWLVQPERTLRAGRANRLPDACDYEEAGIVLAPNGLRLLGGQLGGSLVEFLHALYSEALGKASETSVGVMKWDVWCKRHGLLVGQACTLQQIATERNMTREGIRRMVQRTSTRMAGCLAERPLFRFLLLIIEDSFARHCGAALTDEFATDVAAAGGWVTIPSSGHIRALQAVISQEPALLPYLFEVETGHDTWLVQARAYGVLWDTAMQETDAMLRNPQCSMPVEQFCHQLTQAVRSRQRKTHEDGLEHDSRPCEQIPDQLPLSLLRAILAVLSPDALRDGMIEGYTFSVLRRYPQAGRALRAALEIIGRPTGTDEIIEFVVSHSPHFTHGDDARLRGCLYKRAYFARYGPGIHGLAEWRQPANL